MRSGNRRKQFCRSAAFLMRFIFSEKRGDVRQLAKRLTNVSEGAERFLIVLGGDGTLNEAIQGMQHFEQVRLGYIPTGSSNDLARDLKIGHDIRPLMKKAAGWRHRASDGSWMRHMEC